ncbi:MAG: A/G-specific adenine glycosylase [Anaerolineaceae bacterium]|nr:A/G-specific adenine glycosylase [Anaerolineaceae bacterium]
MTTEIARRLLAWYAVHSRRLPWRADVNPYRVWVSEIMLQQTRVETVIPYFLRWMECFPSLERLAGADEQEVLRVWEGLGYYSRARSLHRAAKTVVEKHSARIPEQRQDLQRLPGIGRSTAAAIASIAFGKDEPALDGNIRRVLARVFDVRLPARSTQGERQLWQLAVAHLPRGCAGDYNQALMDLGATVCTARAPACETCPLADLCQARVLNVQEERPIIAKRPPLPHYTVTAAVIQRGKQTLIARRPSTGFLGGMWEFPGGKLEPGETLAECLQRELREELGVQVAVELPLGVYRHAYTHFRVTLHAFACRLLNGEPQPVKASELTWVEPHALTRFPMGKIDRQIARALEQREVT